MCILVHFCLLTSFERIRTRENKSAGQKDPPEVLVKYNNVHFSDSSKDSIHTPLSLQCFKYNLNNETSCEQPRPIPCPVCTKMIAMSSILLHFYFDHSKVLKLRMNTPKRQHILVKAADISYETKCLAVILLEGESSTGTFKSNLVKANTIRSLLLLAAKMNTVSTNICSKNSIIEEKHNHNRFPRNTFDKNEILLFWTCKTNNDELISNVKLSRKDKKLSFSYTGESIHIKEKQDAKNVYRHAECLIVRGQAANNLVDKDDQIHIFVRCLR